MEGCSWLVKPRKIFGIEIKNLLVIYSPVFPFFILSIRTILGSPFVTGDLAIIFFSQKNSFSFLTYWEYGLKELIPDPKLEVFRYRPFTSFFFWLTTELVGLIPYAWSIVSHAIHLINFFILVKVFTEIQKIFDKENKSLCYSIAFFYLFYPGNVTNTAWISGRIDLLVIFFCLIGLYYALKYIAECKAFFLFINVIAFYLAMMSKENAISYLLVEGLLLYTMQTLCGKNLLTQIKKLFISKLAVVVIYFAQRNFLAGVNDSSTFANFNLINYFTAFCKSVLFTFLPVDSGSFINFYHSSRFGFTFVYGIYFLSLSLVLFSIFKTLKNKVAGILSIGFLISLVTLFFYLKFGGATYRLFVLTFISLLIFLFIIFTYSFNFKTPLPQLKIVSIAGLIIAGYFIFGYIKTSDYWVTNFKLQEQTLSSLMPLYDAEKENIIINYPHSLGQTYCYSDIGTYIYYKKNGTIGRFNNITELAAINSYNEKDYIKGVNISKGNNHFILSSDDDNYFSPGAFFTQKSHIGEIYSNLKIYTMEVLKLNAASKPIEVILRPVNLTDTNSVNFIKFVNGKFERF